MKALLEIHMLQNFAPSNLNRDDTGSPKDAYFGQVRRGRVSSQSFKRAMRMYFAEEELVATEHLSTRTKRFLMAITQRLVESGKAEEQAELAVRNALSAMGTQKKFAFDKKRPELTEVLLSLSEKELGRLMAIILEHWDILAVEKPKVSRELKKALEECLDGGQALDIALFGRMLAKLPEANLDAACQVAHAISTHKIERDEDFYTAVDDLKPDDNAGADMLGTIEFNSACYYRYAVINLAKLQENLLGDDELVVKGAITFLKSAIYALPTGKQNSFAAHQLPSFIGVTVRQDASPRSLANAFETPIYVSNYASQGGLVKQSIEALNKEWTELETIFGQAGVSWVIARGEDELSGVLKNRQVASVEALCEQVLPELERAVHAAGATK